MKRKDTTACQIESQVKYSEGQEPQVGTAAPALEFGAISEKSLNFSQHVSSHLCHEGLKARDFPGPSWYSLCACPGAPDQSCDHIPFRVPAPGVSHQSHLHALQCGHSHSEEILQTPFVKTLLLLLHLNWGSVFICWCCFSGIQWDNFLFLLKYSLFIILYQFQVYSIVIQYFCRLYSIIGYYKIIAIIPSVIQYIFIASLFYTY